MSIPKDESLPSNGKVNYQNKLDEILSADENRGKILLLHSCCAPCSSYVLEYLSTFFRITVFYYNPNIMSDPEYLHRVSEQKRLIETMNGEGVPGRFPIGVMEGDHDTEEYLRRVKGLEGEPEGGGRCAVCFRMRLEKTAEIAAAQNADYFGTTLTISPLKNAQIINGIGFAVAELYGEDLRFLPSDFKKRDGYKRSIELSQKYDLYRQDYCGCEFSRKERENRVKGAKDGCLLHNDPVL